MQKRYMTSEGGGRRRERGTETEKERERERFGGIGWICAAVAPFCVAEE